MIKDNSEYIWDSTGVAKAVEKPDIKFNERPTVHPDYQISDHDAKFDALRRKKNKKHKRKEIHELKRK